MVSELRKALGDTLAALGAVMAVRRWAGLQASLAARPPVDPEAEQYPTGLRHRDGPARAR